MSKWTMVREEADQRRFCEEPKGVVAQVDGVETWASEKSIPESEESGRDFFAEAPGEDVCELSDLVGLLEG